jgi:hypothetical protein
MVNPLEGLEDYSGQEAVIFKDVKTMLNYIQN